jgi:nitrate reductase cytochrome c-type subunit
MKRPGIALLAALVLSAPGALAQGTKSAPPIAHPIDGYMITRAENSCLECHDKPRDIGKPRAKGHNVPAPVSHYGGKLEAKPEIAGTHFNCTSCHSARWDETVPTLRSLLLERAGQSLGAALRD